MVVPDLGVNLRMVHKTQQNAQQHLGDTKDDRHLHLQRVGEGDFVHTTLPDLKQKQLPSESTCKVTHL